VIDRGRGLVPGAVPGFGVRESIQARMAEVGGSATWRAGGGTNVRLTWPAESRTGRSRRCCCGGVARTRSWSWPASWPTPVWPGGTRAIIRCSVPRPPPSQGACSSAPPLLDWSARRTHPLTTVLASDYI